MLWVDKHRPKRLDQLDYHADLTQRLRAIVSAVGEREIRAERACRPRFSFGGMRLILVS